MPRFAKHNKVGHARMVMPTIVSFRKSHAFRMHENGKPGEGMLWNKHTKRFEEPTIEEKEQLLGFNVGDTKGGLATPIQRSERIGRAMDANTMKWLGAFLYAQHELVAQKPVDQPLVGICRIGISRYFTQPSKAFFSVGEMHKPFDVTKPADFADHHYQACAVVQQLLKVENLNSNQDLGGG